MDRKLKIAVVGAGPYGLSVAAHLMTMHCTVVVFGKPFSTWAEAMPKGMMLKSDGFASNLCTPNGQGSLAEFCAAAQIAYSDKQNPVALETFVSYGRDFQRRFVPNLDARSVVRIENSDGRFQVLLEDGEKYEFDKVVLAVGITHFRQMPECLAQLPSELVSHSADHHVVDQFADRDVVVIGAGASAVDLAALLVDSGARTTLVTQRAAIRFTTAPSGRRTLLQRIPRPSSPLGPGWRSRLACDFPWLFRHLPAAIRLHLVRRHLGPSSPWRLRERIVGKATILASQRVKSAAEHDGRVKLALVNVANETSELDADHVIAATGYWPEVERLTFLDRDLRAKIRHTQGVPELSANFETSVSGLYMTGLAAAGSFGPMMRFVAGAKYTSRKIRRHLSRQCASVVTSEMEADVPACGLGNSLAESIARGRSTLPSSPLVVSETSTVSSIQNSGPRP